MPFEEEVPAGVPFEERGFPAGLEEEEVLAGVLFEELGFPAGVDKEEEEEEVPAAVPFEERGVAAGVEEEEEEEEVPAVVPFKDFPAGVAFPDDEDGKWPAGVAFPNTGDEEEEEGGWPAGVAPLVLEDKGWEDLVAHMALLELYEWEALVEEEECLAAEVDEDDEEVEAFFTFFALTAERTFNASLIFRSFSSFIFSFFFSRWHLYR